MTALTTMTAKELIELEQLQKLAHEATDAYNLITTTFSSSFGVNQTSISVYDISDHDEYYGYAHLTSDGKWIYHDNWWGGRDGIIDCRNAETIYAKLRDDYLKIQSCNNIPIGTIVREFRTFLKELKEKNK